jgi:hypothetical protein
MSNAMQWILTGVDLIHFVALSPFSIDRYYIDHTWYGN